ncbi:MAG: cysteine hydrolase [Deinococcales bacterium]
MSENPLLVAVDVQRLYRDFAPWSLPAVEAVAHASARLADALACPLLCTRTVFPSAHGVTDGPWRRYEERWRELAERAGAEPALLEPLPELAGRCQEVFDKHSYSAFGDPAFERRVLDVHPDPLLITGVETDICVLATVFGAIDRNLPVWLVTDAVAGPDARAERGTLATLARMPEQVRLLRTDEAIAALTGGSEGTA